MILDFINDAEREESEGWYLLLGLAIMLLLRLSLFTLNFNVGLQTAIRLSGATQYLGYSKLLRLANPTDKNLGQLITCCTSDQERIVETVVITVLLFGKQFWDYFKRSFISFSTMIVHVSFGFFNSY